MIRFLEFLSSWGGVKRDVVFLILSGLALAVSLIDPALFPIHPAWAVSHPPGLGSHPPVRRTHPPGGGHRPGHGL